ncbi:MAG TPA: multiheme c-type cytochrome [Stellaceae bacterium]|nr:multiheme c-type cytochrome [Stellaceae bacterium]
MNAASAAEASPLGGSLLQEAPAPAKAKAKTGGKAVQQGGPTSNSPLGGSLLQGNQATGNAAAAAPPAGGGSPLGGGLLQAPPPSATSTIFVPGQPPPSPPPEEKTKQETKNEVKGAEDHAALFKVSEFPSALQCAVCHPVQFRQWSISQHAYAEVSVVFHAMQHRINANLSGTNGDFCARCHSEVAGFLSEPADSAVLQRHPVSREGVTCITCHRIAKAYNKVSGRLALVPGGITTPVYGPFDNKELKRVIADPKYHVEPNPKKVGLLIHDDAVYFKPIKSSTFCASCHDVTLFNGFRLEEAYSEYRTGPAAAQGITCQDCHMGKIQGKVSGFERGPVAVVNGIPTETRTQHDHTFAGPDYPIIHPGLFPFNKEAQDLANVNQWTEFDYKAGWGTDAFEKHIPSGYKFPRHWRSVDDRYEAAKIIRAQLKLLEYHKEKRIEVLRNGFGIGAITTEEAGPGGIDFSVVVKNLTSGHNVPTGFTAERPIWLEITVTDQRGKVIFRSGDRDPNGDLRDHDSQWVRAGRVPLDGQLFNLESQVLLRNLRGGEESAILPTPYPLTALPFIRPATFSQILLGRPTGARNQKFSIEPLGQRTADYSIGSDALTGPGIYHVRVRLMSQAVPVSLILATQTVGFDYNYSPKTVVDNVLAGAVAIAERNFDINVR